LTSKMICYQRQAVAGARLAADSLGKVLIEVRTNLREASDGLVEWGTRYHGAALATIGLLLGSVLERIIIPASYHEDDLFPWGSHPELDVLWASSSVLIEHHGESATRPEKVALISKNDAAMANLRICWENPGGAFNCGACEKCMRTMVSLRIFGALDRCNTLPDSIDLRLLRSFRLGHGAGIFARQNLDAIRKSAIQDRELRRTLNQVVWISRFWETARAIRRALRLDRSSV
jgi:hypothetical protein